MEDIKTNPLADFIARINATKDLVSELDKTINDPDTKYQLLAGPTTWLREAEECLTKRHQLESTAGFSLARAEDQLARAKELVARCGPYVRIKS